MMAFGSQKLNDSYGNYRPHGEQDDAHELFLVVVDAVSKKEKAYTVVQRSTFNFKWATRAKAIAVSKHFGI